MTPNAFEQDNGISCVYRGKKDSLFKLVMVNSLLTLLTLGIYRFWGKTRQRKYFWSATAPGGDPMEYTGNGLEKLLGFLIAVAFLTVYLGVFQLFLGFVGMSVFSGSEKPEDIALQIAVAQITLLAVLPFIFYAQYRARRYILSRTRWRGIRFGVEEAAWGYVWRAIGHFFLTIISLGLLWPRQTFWLEKYRIDRTWYGNAKFHQGGNWQMLYPAMKHIFIALALILGSAFLIAMTKSAGFAFLFIVAGIWLYVGIVYYSVHSFRILTAHKTLGEQVTFVSEPSTGTVIKATILGGLLTSICASLLVAVISLIGFSVIGGIGEAFNLMTSASSKTVSGTAEVYSMAVFVLGYVALLLASGAFAMIFIVQPILQHYVLNTRILNIDALHDIAQRTGDDMVEAEGFADALDVGAAI